MMVAKAFVSYARDDARSIVFAPLIDRLDGLVLEGLLDVHYDQRLPTGSDPHGTIEDWINTGDVALVIVSSKFLSRPYVRDTEIPLLQARKTRDPRYLIMPFVLDACDWDRIDIFAQATRCPNEDRSFTEVPKAERGKIIQSAVDHLRIHLASLPQQRKAPLRKVLPSPDRPIFGREPERAAAVAILETTPVLLLYGAAGQGKTELARYVARALQGRFPEGVVEIEVENESQAHNLPPLLAEKLGLRADEDPFEALARSKALILVDGFERLQAHTTPEEQELFLRPFIDALRSGGSRAIITSQIAFRRPQGVKERAVEQLDAEAALALFHAASEGVYQGKAQEGTEQFLTADLAGHPYSIIIVGCYSIGLGLSFAALQREWWDAWHKVGEFRPHLNERGLATAFSLTYESLPTDVRALLAGMGGIPDGLTRAEIDDIWGFASEHLNEGLRTLGQRGLLDERARASQLFRLLGPMYRFAGHKVERLSREEMARVSPYLEALDAFYDAFVREHAPQESDKDPTEKNKLIRRHYHNIHASLERRLIVARSEASVAAGEIVLLMYWAYHNNMVGARDAISASDDAINYLRKARDVFEVNSRPSEVVSCKHYMGLILWLRGEIPQARLYLEEAMSSEHCTDAIRLDHARVFSHIEYKEGSLRTAVALYQTAIRLAQGAGDQRAELSGEIGLMDAYRKLCDFDEAEKAYKRIEPRLAVAPQGVRGNAVRARAYVALLAGDHVWAKKLYDEALGHFGPVSQFGEAHCRRGIGDVFTVQERYEDAAAEYGRALELYDIARKNHSLGVALVRLGMGRMALMRDDPDTAVDEFETAAKMLDKSDLNEPYELAVARELQGEACARNGQTSQALGQFEIAAAQFTKMEALKPRDRVRARITALGGKLEG
jgi:tetratricopeptide (TPR) repeat protein